MWTQWALGVDDHPDAQQFGLLGGVLSITKSLKMLVFVCKKVFLVTLTYLASHRRWADMLCTMRDHDHAFWNLNISRKTTARPLIYHY